MSLCGRRLQLRGESRQPAVSRLPDAVSRRGLAEVDGPVQDSGMNGTQRLLAITRDISPAIEHCELTHLERTTIDRFWLMVGNVAESSDAFGCYERADLRAELERLGAIEVREAVRSSRRS